MSGWIAVHRDIRDHWLWKNPRHCLWWLDLLLMAAWDDHTEFVGKKPVLIKRGCLITSIRNLARRWGACSQTVTDYLRTLENDGMIVRNTDMRITHIRVCNYDKFQPPNADFSENKSVHKSVHNKRNKKINKSTSSTRTREEEFFEQTKASQIFIEQTQRLLKTDETGLQSMLAEFNAETLSTEKKHQDLTDYKRHFINWAKIKNNKTSSNGTETKTGGRPAGDRYEKRRGTEPSDPREKDFDSDF